jgi:large subunit ribosomal protein L13
MNCYQAKAGELAPQWYVIDATDQVVGRLAARIAPILMGKHRPTYTAHIDTGDFVIVTNVEKVVFTGDKWQQKIYQHYTGHPGGQRDEIAWKLHKRHPERILELAIQRMMPKNKIGRHMQAKLKLYVGAQHPHQAQQPIPLDPRKGQITPSGIILKPEPTPAVKKPKTKAPKLEAATPVAAEIAESSLPAPPEHAELPAPEAPTPPTERPTATEVTPPPTES